MDSFEPVKVTVTVISGRNIRARKKGDTCKASVVFGMGKELFQTEEVESSEPYWNQEGHINVNNKTNDSITFKLKDQGTTIGIITMPISSLSRRKKDHWVPLEPYKKEKTSAGDIYLNCYVSEHRIVQSPVDNLSSSPPSDDISPKKMMFHRRSPLHSHRSEGNSKKDSAQSSSKEMLRDDAGVLSDESSGTGEIKSRLLTPEITGISPSQCSIKGNEKVTLRGTNLGESRTDIVKVMVGDVDCTSTLEYLSSVKLVVTTLPRSTPFSGPVTIETLCGGVGMSSFNFSYVNTNLTGGSDHHKQDSHSPQKRPKLSDQEINQMVEENKALKQSVKELNKQIITLTEDNSELRTYMNKLLETIMNHKPELLDIAAASRK